MSNIATRRPAARRAAVLLTTALLLGGGAAPALADGGDPGDQGKASAAVLRAGLEVALLNKTVERPLAASLNEVSAPTGEGSAEKTALTAVLEGVDHGRPFELLRAEVATARATAGTETAEAEVRLADAKIHVPGLPLLSVIEIEAVSARVSCPAGAAPTAEAEVGGQVTVLGRQVTLSAGGTTTVEVPGVGEVRLELSHEETTDRTAAAGALELAVSVNPLNLNVAEVDGRIALAEVSCESPAVGEREKPEVTSEQKPEAEPEEQPEGPRTQTGPQEDAAVEQPDAGRLADTGSDSRTAYLAGGAAALLGIGTLLTLVRRRKGQQSTE